MPLVLIPLLFVLTTGSVHAGESPDDRYQAAAAAYHQLRAQNDAGAEPWRTLAGTFRSIHRLAPDAPRGSDALYSAALAHRQAWRHGGDWRDLSKAAGTFREFAARFPGNRLADDSLMQLATLLAEGYSDRKGLVHTYERLLAEYPQGDQAPAARRALRELREDNAKQQAAITAAEQRQNPVAAEGGGKVVQVSTGPVGSGSTPTPSKDSAQHGDVPATGAIREVQHWTAVEWTRVVITADRQAEYRFDRLAADGRNPERLYLDLTGVIPKASLAQVTPVEDGVLHRIRIGRQGQGTSRVVLDLAKVERTEVRDFLLPNERKIIVDLYRPKAEVRVMVAQGKHAEAAHPGDDPLRNLPGTKPEHPRSPTLVVTPATNPVARPGPSNPQGERGNNAADKSASVDGLGLLRPLGLKVKTVMLDPGHGGHDPGAVAFGVHEKDVALDIAHRLRRIMSLGRPDLTVGMTREDDRFISLNDRPRLAKELGADLFVSIHLNANTIERFYGVETYFLNLTNDSSALSVAARENATSEKRVSDLNLILADLLRDTNMVESSFLAQALQSSVVESLRGTTSKVRDLGVKQAPFLVLMGAEMPSVLVEAGFVTNRVENRRLQNSAYLERIAKGFYDGLREYMEQQDLVASRQGETVATHP